MNKKPLLALAEYYGQKLTIDRSSVIISSALGDIRLSDSEKDKKMHVQFIREEKRSKIKVPISHVYDLVLELLERETDEAGYQPKEGPVLELQDWIDEEGPSFCRNQLESVMNSEEGAQSGHQHLGGSRFIGEYHHHFVLLHDELRLRPAGVIDFDRDVAPALDNQLK